VVALVISGQSLSAVAMTSTPRPTTTTRPTRTPRLTITPSPSPTHTPLKGKIAFVSNRGAKNKTANKTVVGTGTDTFYVDSDIYVMDANGTNVKRLTNLNLQLLSPAWSPDGKHIIFSQKTANPNANNPSGNQALYAVWTMDADGSNLTKLFEHPTYGPDFAWSPDGSRILYESWSGDSTDLYVMNADGSKRTRLTTLPTEDRFPSWSPDGKRIVFSADYPPHPADLYMMNADGDNLTRLTNTRNLDETISSWSPDGTRIFYLAGYYDTDGLDTRKTAIYAMNADGSGVTRLSTYLPEHIFPAIAPMTWSPDRTHVAFTVWGVAKPAQIYVMNIGGSDLFRVSDDETSREWLPAWSPN
jgi:Tol biopolymer transport system component